MPMQAVFLGNQAFSAITLRRPVPVDLRQRVSFTTSTKPCAGQEYTVVEGNTGGFLGNAPDFQVALVGHINLQVTDIVY